MHSVGPAIALSVVPGDTIDMEVWAYYEGGTGYANTIAKETFIATLAGAFGGSSGAGGESGTIFEGVNEAINGGAGGLGSNTDTNVPGAYLSYILFDQNYNEIQSGYHEISDAASFAHEKLFLNDITISQAGYLYIYTSMQSKGTQPVYFDDMKVTHTHSPIASKDDYYPFGLTFASYSRPASVGQNFKYNGKEKISEHGLNWTDYGARMYDAALGRWNGIDAASDLTSRISPYAYAFNNPIRYIDPDGFSPEDIVNMAKYYLGTWYEFGGKNPYYIGGENVSGSFGSGLRMVSNSIRTSQSLHNAVGTMYTSPMIPTRAIYDYHGMNVPQNYSFGIDCSGLARQAFNADRDKLMDNIPHGAYNQLRAFESAEKEGKGYLHSDFNDLKKGDLVFRTDSKGNAYHVMIATGKVIEDSNGNVKEFEVIHAPYTGKQVETTTLSVEDEKEKNAKIGHSFQDYKSSATPNPLHRKKTDSMYSDSFLRWWNNAGTKKSKKKDDKKSK
ncbi:RHS repeat-associated core domain-containing protein [Reichenbachiella sp.]|uniref:RHS repeat-associated core domain-containing protein n=1 Tax=Reichenbachiella sp. TaxID=2184521 RepID=UPI003297DB8B